jgi:hypothetical protein
MPGITLMALIILSVTALACVGLLDLGTRRPWRYAGLILVGLPMSFLVNTFLKGPLIQTIGIAAKIPLVMEVGVTPLWFLLLLWLSAPIFEEWIKVVPFIIPPIGAFLEDAHSALWAGMALGMGFGLGEGIHITLQTVYSPDYVNVAWYLFYGFALERFFSAMINGMLAAVVAVGLQKGRRQGILGYLAAVGLHTLVGIGPILVYVGLVPPLVSIMALVVFSGIYIVVFESLRRKTLEKSA